MSSGRSNSEGEPRPRPHPASRSSRAAESGWGRVRGPTRRAQEAIVRPPRRELAGINVGYSPRLQHGVHGFTSHHGPLGSQTLGSISQEGIKAASEHQAPVTRQGWGPMRVGVPGSEILQGKLRQKTELGLYLKARHSSSPGCFPFFPPYLSNRQALGPLTGLGVGRVLGHHGSPAVAGGLGRARLGRVAGTWVKDGIPLLSWPVGLQWTLASLSSLVAQGIPQSASPRRN